MGSLHTPALTPPLSNPNASAMARRASDGFATTLSAPLTQGSQIASLTAVAGLSTDTAVTLIIDPGTAKQETVIGWVDSLNIVNMARGVENGSETGLNAGADQPHDQGAVVMSYQTAIDHSSMVDFVLADHNPDGTHHPTFLVGETRVWPVASPPDANWLVCDGSSLLRASYPALFALLGTLYGSADGTHFNIPNYKGRTIVGQDAGQSEFAALGQTGGEKTHILLSSEMPSHNHGVTDPGHSHNFNTNVGVFNNHNFSGSGFNPITNDTSGVTISPATTGISVQNTGGGGAHNNLQPYAVANMIIRALP